MYEKMYNKAIKNKLDIVICGSYNVYEDGKREIELNREIFKDKKKNSFFGRMAVWNKIYKREKIKDINEAIFELDIALDLGKDIYAIPGDIFEYESYLANYSIKQGATPICSKFDIEYVLKEKKDNVL